MRCDQIALVKHRVANQRKPQQIRWGRLTVVGAGSLEGGSAFLNRCALGPSANDPLKWSASLAVAIE